MTFFALALALAWPASGQSLPTTPAAPVEPPQLTERQKIIHVLDRLTFGARPGDVETVEKQGLEVFISEQLNPVGMPDGLWQGESSKFNALKLSAVELMKQYPNMGQKKRFGYMFGFGNKPPKDLQGELASAKLARAVLTNRQLEEVMVDFWFNHFNVSFAKNQDKWLVGPYERDVIRPHVFGKFRDLLGAVAHSPAMLVYLDNYQSTVDARYAPLGAQDDITEMEDRMAKNAKGNKNARVKLGLNENYAREVMELHTLGVDGGYTQKDVTELARVLTGWSINAPNLKNNFNDFTFDFKRRMHDPGAKRVLGHDFPWEGVAEGEKALDMLAKHPSTAHFIALKLCRRFVSDDPPVPLVDFVAKRFTETDGDIKETLKALFHAPEFYDHKYFRAKVKTPFEFTVSMLRATNADVGDWVKAARQLDRLGEPLYLCEPPTGYPDRADAWINSGALLTRMTMALGLFNTNPQAPASAQAQAYLQGVDEHDGHKIIQAFVDDFLGGHIAERTRSSILERIDRPELSNKGADGKRTYQLGKLAALILGSPDFQRR
jgi:uncharacterized protein (DUF1800 family)